jgi:hypothetical protein
MSRTVDLCPLALTSPPIAGILLVCRPLNGAECLRCVAARPVRVQ